MENTNHDLYKESLSAKINRLEMTIKELKGLNSMLIKGQEIDKKRYKEAVSIRDKKIDRLTNTVNSLIDQVNYWKSIVQPLKD